MSISDLGVGREAPLSEAAMGAGGSRSTRALVVSLDALGTLYRFKEPVAVQYSNVARQCGFKGEYDTSQLEKAFRSAFKKQSRLYPNYGKGNLPNPQVWWEYLVETTFEPFVTPSTPLPAETGRKLYEHFTSGDAYELFPDVKPFMETLVELKKGFSDPEGPIVLTGIISNSDPRIRDVVTSLGLRVGVSKPEKVEMASSMKNAWNKAGEGRVVTPVNDMYNSQDDFNFMTTSYDAGHEKPDPHIFAEAGITAHQLTLSRLFQENEHPGSFKEAFSMIRKTMDAPTGDDRRTWIHIGDDYAKDYEGAKAWGYEALLLDREGSHQGKENRVSSLEEAGQIINIMAQQSLRSHED